MNSLAERERTAAAELRAVARVHDQDLELPPEVPRNNGRRPLALVAVIVAVMAIGAGVALAATAGGPQDQQVEVAGPDSTRDSAPTSSGAPTTVAPPTPAVVESLPVALPQSLPPGWDFVDQNVDSVGGVPTQRSLSFVKGASLDSPLPEVTLCVTAEVVEVEACGPDAAGRPFQEVRSTDGPATGYLYADESSAAEWAEVVWVDDQEDVQW